MPRLKKEASSFAAKFLVRLTAFRLRPILREMLLRGKKLGLLLSAPLGQPGFQHCLHLAEAALEEGAAVYLYCIDEAVNGADEPHLQSLAARGLKLYVCAYGAQRRGLERNPRAIYAGLALLSDLMDATDRFVSFN